MAARGSQIGNGTGLRERVLAVVVLVVVVVGLFVAFAALGGGGSRSAPPFSSSAYEPTGTRAFYTWLEQRGFRPDRLRRPLQSLTGQEGLLIIVEPVATVVFEEGRQVRRVYAESEVQALFRWVAAGNTALILAGGHSEIHEAVGAIGPGARRPEAWTTVWLDEPLVPVRELDGCSGIPLPVGSQFELQPAAWDLEIEMLDPGAPLVPFVGDADAPGGAMLPFGEGLFIFLADPWPITNEALRPDSAHPDEAIRFLANVAALHAGPQGEVWFDEGHLGYAGQLGIVAFLKRHGQHYALLQLVLVSVLAAWRFGASFGRPRPPELPQGRELTEHVGAVAGIYRHARLRPESLRILLGGLCQDLARALRVPPTTPPVELLAQLQTVDASAAERFRRFLRQAGQVDRHTRTREFVEASRDALLLRDQLRNGELEGLRQGLGGVKS